MSLHDGHRERLKNQFYKHGLDAFNDINVLELLLFFSIPRKDTNETAHLLLERFGSLHGVFDASFAQLIEVPGVGFNSALLISLIFPLLKKIEMSRTAETAYIYNSKDCGKFFIPRFLNEQDEVALLLCIDSSRKIISCIELARGTAKSVNIDIRLVLQTALLNRASSVILAHNHPGGTPVPSIEDDVFTKELRKSLSAIGIKLEDHIVVAGNRYCSMADEGFLYL